MSVEHVLEAVESFFAQWGGAGLKLPSGWFGRPHDNFHELTSASVTGDTLTLVLDEHMTLALDEPKRATVEGAVLRVEGFTQAAWDWREYGSDAEHHERFDGGAVEFVAE